jgi:hypothetical protein
MKASHITYNGRESHKKLELKIVKFGHVKGYPKRPVTQTGLLRILGVKKIHPIGVSVCSS